MGYTDFLKKHTLVGSNLYTTGVTILVRINDEIKPPTIPKVKAEYNGECSIINGIMPLIAVIVVRKIGIK